MDRVDCVVVGAGAIGLAVARPDLAPAAPRRKSPYGCAARRELGPARDDFLTAS